MITSKDLSAEQIEEMKCWAANGAQLPEIQKRLKEDHSLNVTYMDTRFIVLDLGIELQSEEEEAQEDEKATETATSPLDPLNAGPGGVSVELDQLTRPGAMISGSITFSDGERAAWFIDEMGRPGLDPNTPGYQPTEEDLIAFEQELRKLMSEGGAGPA